MTLTVKELIEELKRYPETLPVLIGQYGTEEIYVVKFEGTHIAVKAGATA